MFVAFFLGTSSKSEKPRPKPVEHPIIHSGMPQQAVDRTGHRGAGPTPLRRPLSSIAVPPLAESFLQRGLGTHMVADAALMAGRRTRLGWAPRWQLGHIGRPVMEQEFKVRWYCWCCVDALLSAMVAIGCPSNPCHQIRVTIV